MGAANTVAVFSEQREWWADEAVRIAEYPSRWQEVIHGESLGFRVAVLEELAESWGGKRAKRYALCGRGDRVGKNGEGGVSVRPFGCGEALCPRCSRRRGVRVLRALDFRFREQGHGALYHLVLTQRVYEEPLERTKVRMERQWKRAQRRLKGLGPVGMLCVIHCTWSRHGGFHYHLHVIAEFDKDVDLSCFAEGWGDQEVGQQAAFFKRVSNPMTAEQCGAPQDLIHGVDAVGSGIGYVVGEIVKGVGRFGTDGCPQGRLKEVVAAVTGLKRQRLYGDWRGCVGKCEQALKEARAVEEKEGKPKSEEPTVDWDYDSMTVDEAWSEAQQGEDFARDLMRGLIERYPGASFLCEQVRGFCMEALVER